MLLSRYACALLRPPGDRMHSILRPLAALTLACLLFSGCRVNEHKDGKNDNVSIETPFGNTSIKTNDAANTASIGMAAYPGAVPVKDDDGKDSGSANVNMSFGSFHLGVNATSFQTQDSQDKVLAFYRKDLAKYGDVIECRDNKPVGQPTRTSQGLACDEKDHSHYKNGSNDTGLELRAGSEMHQHIVGLEQKNGGIKIGLVSLELPSHFGDKGKNPE
jgi:hypothetical protein